MSAYHRVFLLFVLPSTLLFWCWLKLLTWSLSGPWFHLLIFRCIFRASHTFLWLPAPSPAFTLTLTLWLAAAGPSILWLFPPSSAPSLATPTTRSSSFRLRSGSSSPSGSLRGWQGVVLKDNIDVPSKTCMLSRPPMSYFSTE